MSFKSTDLNPFGLLIEAETPNEDVHSLDIAAIREACRRHHLVVLRGFKTFDSSKGFSDYCELWGEIALWPFGKVLELIEQKNPEDHIFDHSYVPMHWDGMYRPQVPEFQIFHCAVAPEDDKGGRTTFSNTPLVLKNAAPEAVRLWTRATGVYTRKMEFYNSKTVAPIITQHPDSKASVIRYCEKTSPDDKDFINHPSIEIEGLSEDEVVDLHSTLKEALYAPENFYAHAWQTGDVVISDNYTLLHGREAFVSGSPRYLRRVHILGENSLANPHLVAHS